MNKRKGTSIDSDSFSAGFCSCKTGIQYILYISARKHRAQDHSVYSIHERLSTELTPQSREKTIKRGTLEFISGILLTYGFILCITPYAQAASDGFGRLFTTPEERRNLQILRYSAPEIDEVIEIIVEVDEVAEEKTEPRDIDGITLNGIVYRQGGKSTAWLNGSNSYEGSLTSEYFRINTGDINSMKVSVTVPEAGLEFDLKVGQTYEPNYDRLLDIVENGDEITISVD